MGPSFHPFPHAQTLALFPVSIIPSALPVSLAVCVRVHVDVHVCALAHIWVRACLHACPLETNGEAVRQHASA